MRRAMVKDLLDFKGQRQLTEVTVNTIKEAEACEMAQLDMITTNEHNNISAIRLAAPSTFLTVGLNHGEYFSKVEVKKAAFALLKQGADAIYCPVNQKWIEALSEEGIPAVGHAGMIPQMATWTGGFSPVAQNAKEAFQLYKSVRNLRAAGAFAVQMELVPHKVAEEISKRTKVLIFSRGSGSGCDGQSLFAEALLGYNQGQVPQYAKSYRNHAVEYERLHQDSILAFGEYKKDVASNRYPLGTHQVDIAKEEFETFIYALEKALAKKG